METIVQQNTCRQHETFLHGEEEIVEIGRQKAAKIGDHFLLRNTPLTPGLTCEQQFIQDLILLIQTNEPENNEALKHLLHYHPVATKYAKFALKEEREQEEKQFVYQFNHQLMVAAIDAHNTTAIAILANNQNNYKKGEHGGLQHFQWPQLLVRAMDNQLFAEMDRTHPEAGIAEQMGIYNNYNKYENTHTIFIALCENLTSSMFAQWNKQWTYIFQIAIKHNLPDIVKDLAEYFTYKHTQIPPHIMVAALDENAVEIVKILFLHSLIKDQTGWVTSTYLPTDIVKQCIHYTTIIHARGFSEQEREAIHPSSVLLPAVSCNDDSMSCIGSKYEAMIWLQREMWELQRGTIVKKNA